MFNPAGVVETFDDNKRNLTVALIAVEPLRGSVCSNPVMVDQ